MRSNFDLGDALQELERVRLRRIEVIAKAMYEAERGEEGFGWSQADEPVRAEWRHEARKFLAAAEALWRILEDDRRGGGWQSP